VIQFSPTGEAMRSKSLKITYLLFFVILISGCGPSSKCEFTVSPGDDAQQKFQTALNEIESGCIALEEGTYDFSRTLTLDGKAGVTIRGAGRDTTVLSFASQVSGGDGVLITNSQDIIVRDLTIRDAVGDALKFRETDGVVVQAVGTVWSGEPSADNGAYGIYPVLSKNILIDDSYAYGASDAGIYVGQSDKAIVRNSKAKGNVAGIEIENTTNADVYNNAVSDNTAGILVFDLPDLSQSGAQTRVFNNEIADNMRGNFAPAGNIVAQVPAGTGILVLSTKSVEVFDNTIEGNNVAGTAVASYAALVELGVAPKPTDPDYNIFPGDVYIHDNTYKRSNNYPPEEQQSDFGNLLVNSFGQKPIPDIIVDGIWAPQNGTSGSICLQDNTGNGFVNLNLGNNFPQNLSFDPAAHRCSMDALSAVKVDAPKL
jgi:parallel beta-helix repeat protein